MLNIFESNVANGIGSMEIYNLKVKCTISCNVFYSKLYILINADVYMFRIALLNILCNFIVVCKFRVKMKITIVVIKLCYIKFAKVIPMICGRPTWFATSFVKSNLFHNLVAYNIPIVFPQFSDWLGTFIKGFNKHCVVFF